MKASTKFATVGTMLSKAIERRVEGKPPASVEEDEAEVSVKAEPAVANKAAPKTANKAAKPKGKQ